jgi:magnesium-transporting ATPase (P-type)
MTLETRQNNREAFGLTRNVMTATNVEKLVEHSWHHLSVEKVARLLDTDLEIGLSSEVSAQRREILGPNQLTAQKQQSAWLRFFQQLNQLLIYILLASGIVTAFLKEWIDSGLTLPGLKAWGFFVRRANLLRQDFSRQSRGRISQSVRVFDPSSGMPYRT